MNFTGARLVEGMLIRGGTLIFFSTKCPGGTLIRRGTFIFSPQNVQGVRLLGGVRQLGSEE